MTARGWMAREAEVDAVEVRERFNRLLADLAARVGSTAVEAGPDGACHLSFEPDTELSMLASPLDGNLIVWTSPGMLSGDKEAACRRLLEANLFWRGTDGATLSLLPETDNIVLTMRQPLDGLDAEGLQDLIERMVEQSERLHRELAANGHAQPAAEGAVGFAPQMLRG